MDRDVLDAAEKHLSKYDKRMKKVIQRVGPCTLTLNPNHFTVLARSIISQQISGKAAESISGRLVKLCGRSGLRPSRIAALTDEELRSCGVSTSKLLSLRSLADHFIQNRALGQKLKTFEDEEVIEALIPIRGIGRWTAQMFLMFSLGRTDVLPIADLGFKLGMKDLYELDDEPTKEEIEQISEPWRPYRSIATWYLWRCRDGK